MAKTMTHEIGNTYDDAVILACNYVKKFNKPFHVVKANAGGYAVVQSTTKPIEATIDTDHRLTRPDGLTMVIDEYSKMEV